MINAEPRTPDGPQHLQALERANAVRLARAELKRRVAEGEISTAAVILDAPWEAKSMTISDLLTSQRRWGHTRCRKFLRDVPMSENKTLGSMTQRQRLALAQRLAPTPEADEAHADGQMAPALAGAA